MNKNASFGEISFSTNDLFKHIEVEKSEIGQKNV